MSIKVTGAPPFRPSADQSKRVKKSGANFEDSLKTNEVPKVKSNADSVKLSGSVKNNQGGYQPPSVKQNTIADNSLSADVKALSSKVLTSEEEANKRVQEIKNIIEKGGAKAYLDSVDSEKIAERLLNSGILDDIV